MKTSWVVPCRRKKKPGHSQGHVRDPTTAVSSEQMSTRVLDLTAPSRDQHSDPSGDIILRYRRLEHQTSPARKQSRSSRRSEKRRKRQNDYTKKQKYCVTLAGLCKGNDKVIDHPRLQVFSIVCGEQKRVDDVVALFLAFCSQSPPTVTLSIPTAWFPRAIGLPPSSIPTASRPLDTTALL